eukprot:3653783-Pleurochrysis_carterae.AAC.1
MRSEGQAGGGDGVAPMQLRNRCGEKQGRRARVSERAVWLHATNVIPAGPVWPGDIVAATVFANHVYTGIRGDIF